MKKVDFTIKGTKLPVIPKGTIYTTVNSVKWHKTTEFNSGLNQLKSEGITTGLEGCIYASHFTTGDNHYIFHLSTIKRLAEEQGMLYEKETERDWTGVRFIEVKQETEYDKRNKMAETLTENIFCKYAFTPSIQSLLQRATVAEYHIRTGCQMFIGVDEVERLEQMKACERELKGAVLQLHSLLNK